MGDIKFIFWTKPHPNHTNCRAARKKAPGPDRAVILSGDESIVTLFDSPAFDGHESITAFRDEDSGLSCIFAFHSTLRGPGAGGCRMLPYADTDAALRDALLLSRAMSFKSAIADLALGGAWSVIIGDSRTGKSPNLFEAYGRAVETFSGRFWAIVDVGTTASDLRLARTQSRYITGLDGHPAAAGDPSPITAESVFRSVTLGVKRLHGSSLSGVRIAIQGVGQVGASLAEKFNKAGARLIIADADNDVARAVADRTGAAIVPPEAIIAQDVDVFCPCALGGTISNQALEHLQARIVAGGANNQLATPELGKRLFERGILYAPDYVANAGGIVGIAGEIGASQRGEPFDVDWVSGKLDRLMQTLDDIFERSAAEHRPTDQIADDIAKERLISKAAV